MVLVSRQALGNVGKIRVRGDAQPERKILESPEIRRLREAARGSYDARAHDHVAGDDVVGAEQIVPRDPRAPAARIGPFVLSAGPIDSRGVRACRTEPSDMTRLRLGLVRQPLVIAVEERHPGALRRRDAAIAGNGWQTGMAPRQPLRPIAPLALGEPLPAVVRRAIIADQQPDCALLRSDRRDGTRQIARAIPRRHDHRHGIVST